MAEKINIAELLKDCPSGLELNCTMYDNVVLDTISDGSIYPIKIKTPEHFIFLTKNGCYSDNKFSKCVIFPKGKTTWEGFVPPYKFKDGDVCYIKTKALFEHIFIFKVNEDYKYIHDYVDLSEYFFACGSPVCSTDCVKEIRLATEEEKQKLFDAIKSHGYKWNADTKTLEKLVKPKFKDGDIIQNDDGCKVEIVVVNEEDEYYGTIVKGVGNIAFSEQDDWELVPDKFDVINFEPFMKVLVRSDNSDVWECDFFSLYNPKCSNRFHCIGAWYNICIPYIGNEHLLGTTDDCDDFYKTWG